MNLEDFEKDDTFAFKTTCNLWGENTEVFIDLFSEDELEAKLKEFLPIIEEKIIWIDRNRNIIEKELINDDMVGLAEDWASSAEEAEDEEVECYIMEDGQKVFLPISNEDFCNSLKISGITMNCHEKEDVWMEMFLICDPDYFAYHAIYVIIDANMNVKSNGLAG